MLRKYFAIFRTRAMINCYCPDGISRGAFRFYSFATKKKLYLKGYKEMDMGAMRPDFLGKFVDTYGFFVDAEEYEAKKDEAIKKLTQDDTSFEEKLKEQFKDYKEKLKLDLASFKEKMKERVAKSQQEYKEKLKDIKSNTQNLVKKSDEKKIATLQEKYLKILHTIFYFMSEDYEIKNPGSSMSKSFFIKFLKEKSNFDISMQSLNKDLQDANDLLEIEKANTNK